MGAVESRLDQAGTPRRASRRLYLPGLVLAGLAAWLSWHSARSTGQRKREGLMWLLYLADAGLLVASGLIHLHLWDIAYRHVATLDVLFLVQVFLCALASLALLATRHLLVVLAAAALMAGTIVGFLLARSAGTFGFKLTFSSGLANTVLTVEVAGVVMLALTARLLLKRDGVPQLKRRGRHQARGRLILQDGRPA